MRGYILIIIFILFPGLFWTLLEAGASLTGLSILLFILLLPLLQSAFIFPLPIRDTNAVRYKSWPWMTITIIGINCFVFFILQGASYFRALFAETETEALNAIYDFISLNWTYGWRKTIIYDGLSIGAFTTFTAMFMHGDLSHLFGNMVYLWAFGQRVEDACGPWRYGVFYLLAGMIAHSASAIFLPTGPYDVPSIGASGAISGVLGAYLLLFPSARVDCLWGITIILRGLLRIPSFLFGTDISDDDEPHWKWTISIPAWILLIIYAIDNIIPSFQIIQGLRTDTNGINSVAHMFGFLAAIAIFAFVRKDLLARYLAGRRL